MTKEGGIKVMGFESAIKLSPGQNYIEESDSDKFFKYNFIYCPKKFLELNEDIIAFSYESDLWAVGRIMYYLLFGCEPLIYEYTDMNKFLKPIPFGISYQAADCLRRLLEPIPKKRHKLNLIHMLPFFNNNF